LFWTPRHFDHSWRYLNHLFLSGRYRAVEKSELEKQISKISKNRGQVLQKEVVDWLKNNATCDIYEEVGISSSGRLKHSIDIGDVDILVIDKINKVVLSIECKRTEQAKNAKEMIEQVEQYYGRGSKKGYFQKHIDRHLWLNRNLSELKNLTIVNLDGYTVYSFFVTYEILAIQFMKNRVLPIKIISLFDLKGLSYNDLLLSFGKR